MTPTEEDLQKAREWLTRLANDPPGVQFVSGPVILSVEDVAAFRAEARWEADQIISALHAKLQGAFALLTPEDSEALGITAEMVACERTACAEYEAHVLHAVESEREACERIVAEIEETWRLISADRYVRPELPIHLSARMNDALRRLRERAK